MYRRHKYEKQQQRKTIFFCDAGPHLPVFYALGYHPTLDKIFFVSGLSHSWCSRVELNHRHEDFQSSALPTELQEHIQDAKE